MFYEKRHGFRVISTISQSHSFVKLLAPMPFVQEPLMPKLIIRRVSNDDSAVDVFRDDVLNAVLTLPGVTSAVTLLESNEAIRIEFDWEEPRYESIEKHLNRFGLALND